MIHLQLDLAGHARSLIQAKIDSLALEGDVLAIFMPTTYCGDVIQILSFPSTSLVYHYSHLEDIFIQELHYKTSILVNFTLNPLDSIEFDYSRFFDLVIFDFCHVYPSTKIIHHCLTRLTAPELSHDRLYLLFSPRKFFKFPVPSISIKISLCNTHETMPAEPVKLTILVILAIFVFGALSVRIMILCISRYSIHTVRSAIARRRLPKFLPLIVFVISSLSFSFGDYFLAIKLFIRSLSAVSFDSLRIIPSIVVRFLAASESYMLYKLSRARLMIEQKLETPSLSSQFSEIFFYTEYLAVYFDKRSYLPNRHKLLAHNVFPWGDFCLGAQVCSSKRPAYICVDIVNLIPCFFS